MLRYGAQRRLAARLFAAVQEPVRSLIEPLECRRLLNAGQLDTNFASTGYAADTSLTAPGLGGGVVVQSTGKTVILGEDANHHAVLERYNANGALDPTFGTGGRVVVTAFTGGDDGLALGPGDELVIGGGSIVARFTANGSPDGTFGSGGFISNAANVLAVAVQGDGKILTAGSSSQMFTGEVERFNVNGTVDGGFGSGGAFIFASKSIFRQVAVGIGGEIAVVGQNTVADAGTPLMLTLDSTGKNENIPFSSSVLSGAFSSVAQSVYGDWIAVGYDLTGQGQLGVVVDFPTGGATPGKASWVAATNNGNTLTSVGFLDVAVQKDGKIIAVGSSGYISSTADVERLNAGGSLDTTFGDGGSKEFSNVTGYNSSGVAVALTADDTVRVLAADTEFVGSGHDVELLALTGDPVESTFPAAHFPIPPALTDFHEAENFDRGGEGVGFHDTEGANLGGQWRTDGVDIEHSLDAGGGNDVGWTHSGEWLKYTLGGGGGGVYDVKLRVANAGSGGSFHLEINGAIATPSIAIPDTGDFQKWVTLDAGKVVVPGNATNLKIVFDGNSKYGFSGNINSFTFTPVPPPGIPFGGTPFAVGQRIEAENFDLGGQGVGYFDMDAVNSGGQYRPSEGVDIEKTTDAGGGYDVGWTHTGEYLDYTGTFPSSDIYSVTLRLANVGTGGTFQIFIDGQQTVNFTEIPNTGGFQNFTNVTVNGLSISGGKHTVRVLFSSQAGSGFSGNLNWLEFTPTNAGAGTPFGGTARQFPGVVQAEDYNVGGDGVAYHDTDNVNQGGAYRNDGVDVEAQNGVGYVVDYAKAGEWLNYTVNDTAYGTSFSARVANSGAGGAFHVEIDGVNVTGTRAVPNTGSFTQFDDVLVLGLNVAPGQHVVRIVWDANSQFGFAGNMDYFSIG